MFTSSEAGHPSLKSSAGFFIIAKKGQVQVPLSRPLPVVEEYAGQSPQLIFTLPLLHGSILMKKWCPTTPWVLSLVEGDKLHPLLNPSAINVDLKWVRCPSESAMMDGYVALYKALEEHQQNRSIAVRPCGCCGDQSPQIHDGHHSSCHSVTARVHSTTTPKYFLLAVAL